MKKETLAQVFSCKFCEISKNTFFTEHFRTTASVTPHSVWQKRAKQPQRKLDLVRNPKFLQKCNYSCIWVSWKIDSPSHIYRVCFKNPEVLHQVILLHGQTFCTFSWLCTYLVYTWANEWRNGRHIWNNTPFHSMHIRLNLTILPTPNFPFNQSLL